VRPCVRCVNRWNEPCHCAQRRRVGTVRQRAQYSSEVQQPDHRIAAEHDGCQPADLVGDPGRPPCPEFASRGSGVRIPSAPPLIRGRLPMWETASERSRGVRARPSPLCRKICIAARTCMSFSAGSDAGVPGVVDPDTGSPAAGTPSASGVTVLGDEPPWSCLFRAASARSGVAPGLRGFRRGRPSRFPVCAQPVPRTRGAHGRDHSPLLRDVPPHGVQDRWRTSASG
jgi:hypothetical protein